MKKVKGIKEFYYDTVNMGSDEWYKNLTMMMSFLEKVIENFLLHLSFESRLFCN